MKPKALDLFCCAGGAARGLQMAGFEVYGVDIEPQPRYAGDYFVQGDALNPPFDLGAFDFIWASPPCQAFSVASAVHSPDIRKQHPNPIPATRALLRSSGKAYCIENVVGAPLENPITLCGTMFGLKVYRHRLFETNYFMMVPAHPPHRERLPRAGRGPNANGWLSVAGHFPNVDAGRKAMGIEWMSRDELSQAIPPAYSEYIGRAAMQYINTKRAA